jgi:hypothetical protein
VVCRQSCLVLAVACGGHDTHHTGAAHVPIVAAITVGHDYDPLNMLLAPLLATPCTLFSVLDNDVGRHPSTADRGCLPASFGGKKFGRLIAGGVLGGGTTYLLGGVPKNVTVFALAWVPCVVFRSLVRVPLESLLVSLGLSVPALSPQQDLGQEVTWWLWCHPCSGRLHNRPLPIVPGPNWVRSLVRQALAGTLH